MSETVASTVVDALITNGIEHLYCLPGVQNDEFFDALYDKQGLLPPVQARHEQGAAYMALGAALATGKPQAFCLVPGPGFLNGTAALATAYAVNAPVLALIGQIPLGAIGKDLGLLHEIPDQLGTMERLTKQATQVTGGNDVTAVLNKTFTALVSGRPRPVGVEVPVNTWKQPVTSGPIVKAAPLASPAPDTDKIDQAAKLLAGSRRPMIVVGSGAQAFSTEVRQLAEMFDAPVMAFRNGRGVLASDHELSINTPVAHDLWRTVDLVVGLGTRLQTPLSQWGVDEQLQVIHIDIDPQEIGRSHQPTIGIHADLADALPGLIQAGQGHEARHADWKALVRKTKERFNKICLDQLGPQMAWLSAIRDVLPRNGLFVDELTQVGYVSRFAFPVYEPRTFLSTGYLGNLGWGFASALGAAHARPDVPVVSISGDGGALYTISELATAMRHNISVTSIVFNDNAFGNVRRGQIETYNNRPIASDLSSPDFVKLAQSFGAQGLLASTPDELRTQLAIAIAYKGPTVIEVPVGDFPSPWDFVLMPKLRGK
ncbi:MAG: thiamine pyrophosphate-dependent enzyme [Burkholderiaceae bacterium]